MEKTVCVPCPVLAVLFGVVEKCLVSVVPRVQ